MAQGFEGIARTAAFLKGPELRFNGVSLVDWEFGRVEKRSYDWGQICSLWRVVRMPARILNRERLGAGIGAEKNKFFLNRTWLSDLKIRDKQEVNIRYNLGAPKFSIRLA